MADFKMKRGDTKVFDYAVVDEDGVAVDLTGGKVWFSAKKKSTDTDANAVIAISSATAAVTITAGTGGTGVITIPSTATTSLTVPTLLYYDLQAKTATGQIFTVADGELDVTLDITQTTT
jgi:hypothetical protein